MDPLMTGSATGNFSAALSVSGKSGLMSKQSSLMDDFRPIMPPLIRLIAGIIVLVVIQATVLGFPGITALIPTTTFTIAALVVFTLGLIVSAIVLKFGTQLATGVGEAYKSYRSFTPLLAWLFQMVALVILYDVSKPITASYFATIPWAYPLIFLLIALGPTIKVVMNTVNALEGKNTSKHLLNN
jgi:hypothetical protein